MSEHTPDRDAMYIERVANAASIRGLMEDPRWPFLVAVINKFRNSAESRAKAAMKNPSFDGIAQATHFGGQVAFADNLLHAFNRMSVAAEAILEEARSVLPRAPAPAGTPRNDAAPEGTPAKEEPRE